ncbi:glycosyltransferase involved in cell wall biosynthesis [Evansella vedderi]|uniref:Glycosyltransferase involved in cell wall biosynthesis n=1 Tax=Evansella vedderi TaxID=38282 RepID=A0ABT9ZZA7_9BACI|nr:glycosyltransferase [Evansella vedderi]MDQ0256576.1 glycosyltransferase involved in cell wall biosynthesis [Evansella vedderi]
MKDILISSFDMEVGGVERSLISMLEHFDYETYKVDLMLYRHQGEFMKLIPKEVNLLKESLPYTSFRKSISELIREKNYPLAVTRVLAKLNTNILGRMKKMEEPGYLQMQLMWRYALPFLPNVEKEYDVAISYLWPHYFIAEKVKAKKKIAWIHTDYSKIETDSRMDIEMWNKFDHIVAVSDACKESFIKKYKELTNKVIVMENITSPLFIKKMAIEQTAHEMLPDKRFKLMTVARLSHAKGIDNGVKALKLLKEKGYNIAWYVVGYGGDEDKVKQLVRKNNLENDFILLGKKTNPYPYIYASDIYVQPSRYEGKAVTVTEAKILGKPIIITNYSTSSSQLTDGIDGIVCDLSVEGIANGLEILLLNENLRNQLANNCMNNDYSNSDELQHLYYLIDKECQRNHLKSSVKGVI